MTSFLSELRRAFRLLRRRPAVTAVIVGSLGLGLGANTAVFSFVNAIQFKPLPVADESTLVDVSEWSATRLCAGCGVGASAPAYLEWRARASSFAGMEAYKDVPFILSGAGEAERAGGAIVSSGLFALIGVQPALGRSFSPDDDRPGAPPVVIVGDRIWQRLFGRAPEALGRTLKVDGVARTIVGVMPGGFRFPEFAQLWVPLQAFPLPATKRASSRSRSVRRRQLSAVRRKYGRW